MTLPAPSSAPCDAELVAYLDGELSPADSVRIGQRIAGDAAVAARLDVLIRGVRPFKDAFDPLLARAPGERLEAMLADVLDQRQGAAPFAPRLRRGRWLSAVVAGIALMVAGAGLDRLIVKPVGPWLLALVRGDDESADWRRDVVRYFSLYTKDTLSEKPTSPEVRRRQLASVGAKLGLDLDPARVEFPDIALKEAEALDYDGQPLGLLAYFDPKSGSVALCILAGAKADEPLSVEHRNGMTIVYWSRATHGFMLIGRGGVEELRARAEVIAGRFGGAASDRSDDDHG